MSKMIHIFSYYIYRIFFYSDARVFWRQCGLTFILILGIIYFLYHGKNGDFGTDSKNIVKNHIEILQKDIARKQESISLLEKDIESLGSHLDHDKVDEEIRKRLNYANPDEYIIILE